MEPSVEGGLKPLSFPYDPKGFSEIVLYPSGKAPVVFKGVSLLERNYATLHEFHSRYEVYLNDSFDLIFLRSIPEFGNENEGNDGEFIKIRKMLDYHDIWTFFKGCERDYFYLQFLKETSNLITETESYFWIPL